ncbi:hypothetical protein BDN71DRAFT_1446148 [Pleurotus eryngii]|uniref:Uncharacterized protein n=1 Tax=Pleurotus eryngii TaxID=5323 RepID=A0A9P5ZZR6_PLEER|nr:hypothetical protein BDN71DRAFT_1446148 [Pleurotus eryngii]
MVLPFRFIINFGGGSATLGVGLRRIRTRKQFKACYLAPKKVGPVFALNELRPNYRP